ncbi:HdeD family acid-resistance protein [Dictyobacter aurantiacus]|uniref:Membrane protein n=1 Tax=Dictyobacter aurantiacus TaxID=1936993 RepID=A0A401ZRX8_9CHLR|nr:HdeD family acid-resistance protein [Dictyobacter aurantiacus]GCE09625.1 membrane protein [Dictyobacter aurantiacus]
MQQTMIRDYHWSLLFRGVIAILFGILALGWPGKTLLLLVVLFGAYAIVDGIANVFSAIRGRSLHNWGLLLLEGIVSILAGIIAFVWPGLTALAFVYVIAAWAVITGIAEVVAAFSSQLNVGTDWWLALAGLASIIFGIWIAIQPRLGLLAVIWLIGFYAIIFGVLFLVRYFQSRSRVYPASHMPGSGVA